RDALHGAGLGPRELGVQDVPRLDLREPAPRLPAPPAEGIDAPEETHPAQGGAPAAATVGATKAAPGAARGSAAAEGTRVVGNGGGPKALGGVGGRRGS